ncbi:MAG TPA: response regulator [Chloroflexi bacterium]|nr:response regulator [Chloroflexota bacterium]
MEMTAVETSDMVKGKQELILLVEDNDTTRLAITQGLESLNYRVLQARDGLEAMDVLDRSADQIALVLSDVVIPRMGGVALLRTLHARQWHIPFVMLTGHTQQNQMTSLQNYGLSGWLTKPLRLESLAQVVAQVLTQEDRDDRNDR